MTTTITLDGSAHGTQAGAATTTATLTTTHYPDRIYAIVAWLDTGKKTVSVSSTHVSFLPRGGPMHNGNYKMQAFSGMSTAALTNEVITATFSGIPSGNTALVVFGAENALSNDHGSPVYALKSAVTATSFSIATNTMPADMMCIGAIMLNPDNAVTAGVESTEIANVDATDFIFEVEYLNTVAPATTTLTWTGLVSVAYTGFTYVDNLIGITSQFPYETVRKGAVTSGATGQWYMPVVTQVGNVITYDETNGAMSYSIEREYSARHPILDNTDNAWSE
jgi:hypothetical protein